MKSLGDAHDGNCDKMINNQVHKLCARLALTTRISQCRGEYTRDGQSINFRSFVLFLLNVLMC